MERFEGTCVRCSIVGAIPLLARMQNPRGFPAAVARKLRFPDENRAAFFAPYSTPIHTSSTTVRLLHVSAVESWLGDEVMHKTARVWETCRYDRHLSEPLQEKRLQGQHANPRDASPGCKCV